MTFDYLVGFLVAEGSLTGDKLQPCISIRTRDTSAATLEYLATRWGGRLYGPYSPGRSLAHGDVYQVMWRGKALKDLVRELEGVDFDTIAPHFGEKLAAWRARYSV